MSKEFYIDTKSFAFLLWVMLVTFILVLYGTNAITSVSNGFNRSVFASCVSFVWLIFAYMILKAMYLNMKTKGDDEK